MARVPIKCPPLGVSVFTGVLAEWFVQPGDQVKVDQPLWAVETDKVTQEVLSPAAGVIEELLVEPGEVVEPEMIVGYIGDGSGTATAKEAPAQAAAAAAASASPANADPPKAAPATTVAAPAPAPSSNGAASGNGLAVAGRPHRYSPRIRRLMREHKLSEAELGSIRGSGRQGRLTAADVERYLASGRKAEQAAPAGAVAPLPPPPPAAVAQGPAAAPRPAPVAAIPTPLAPGEESWETSRLTTIRKTIATYLRASVDNAVHTVSIDECEVTRLLAARKSINEVVVPQYGIKITLTAMVAMAVAKALREFPLLNSQLDLEKDEVRTARHVHLGIAVDAPQGLTVPVVRFADQLGLVQLQSEINRLAGLVRENKASLADLQGSTYTLTNAGAEGSIASTPIINYPNVGILGVHKIRQMPVVREGQIVIRDMVNLSGCFDHRLVDGVYHVRFLNRVIQYLEEPVLLFL